MKSLWIIIIASILAPLAWSQSIPISGFVIDQYGQPVAGAQVYICSAAGSSGLPCTPVASIFQDYNLTIAAANPTQTDANGNFNVYVGALPFPNTYVVNMVVPTGPTYTQLYPGPSCPLGGCTFTGPVTAPFFNATQFPYYEINGVQISASALSDYSNLAKLNASNTFTGTTQTAPIWNATTSFDVNGTPLASTNLSDTSNLARLNASNVFTGATNTFAAITGTTINATAGFQVGGVALSASNLSNGVSGTGAVCLASGSACAFSGSIFYQTVQAGGVSKPQESKLNLIQGANTSLSCADNPGSSSTDCTISSSTATAANPNIPTITCGAGCTPFSGYNDGAGIVSSNDISGLTFTLSFGGTYPHEMACTTGNSSNTPGNVVENRYLITQSSVTTGVASFSTPDTTGLTPGTTVDLEGFETATFFNGQIVTVLATGLTPTQFEANFSHTDTGTILDQAFALPNNPYGVTITGGSGSGAGVLTVSYLCHQ